MSKRLFKTMAAVLAIAAAAAGPVRAQSNHTKYTSAVAISALQVGDTLAEGATIIGSGDDDDMVFIFAGRTKENGVVQSWWTNLHEPPTVIGTNGTISGTYTPVDENGQDGNAWVVTTAERNDDDGFEVGLEGIRIPGPPHTVRMAEGTEDAANWSLASGNASVPGNQVLQNVMSGSQVTATYNGTTKKVKSVKAVKYVAEPVSGIVNPVVGQVIGSDGKNYDADATLPTGVTAVAKIAYVGSDNGEDAPYNHGLALALSDVSSSFYTWCSQTTATCLGTGHQFDSKASAKGDLAGIANTDALVNNAPAGHTHDAASAARNYNSGTHPTGTSEWFLPSAGQWDKMATAAGGYGTLKTNAGLQSDYYWSSSESSSADKAWYVYSTDGFWTNGYKDNGARVRACLAF